MYSSTPLLLSFIVFFLLSFSLPIYYFDILPCIYFFFLRYLSIFFIFLSLAVIYFFPFFYLFYFYFFHSFSLLPFIKNFLEAKTWNAVLHELQKVIMFKILIYFNYFRSFCMFARLIKILCHRVEFLLGRISQMRT